MPPPTGSLYKNKNTPSPLFKLPRFNSVLTFFPNMKKLLLVVLVFTVLLLQAWAEASSAIVAEVHSAATSDESTDATTDGIKRYPYHPKKKINCNGACSKRCSESSRKNVCHRACNTCCQRCRCVPPGTSGHASACPCYASLRTHGNRRKCP